MQYKELGRTGLRVSVAGFGCGGSSRLGLGSGGSEAEAVALLQRAIDLGVNFFDTAEAYGTEEIVGRAIRGRPREAVVISTKCRLRPEGKLLDGAGVAASLEASLSRLGTDHVDVFHLHGVPPRDYDYVVDALVPALLREKEKGKLRHLGITETAPNDPRHEMLARAIPAGPFEVVMVAFHLMNQNTRAKVFPLALQHGVGTLLMFVVRRIFSDPPYFAETVAKLRAEGQLPPGEVDPLAFLLHEGGATDVMDAAYRFARHQPGADVVLFGTGSIAHLERNVASILKPPLPEADLAELYRRFGHLEGVGLDLPRR
jgi:aryl-alcohol dehydrogenase-like predicted oxidoreductase